MKKIKINGKIYPLHVLIKLLIQHLELRNWAIHHHMGNYLSIFENDLIKQGFDFPALLPQLVHSPREILNRISTHEILLYCDSKATNRRFAICDDAGKPLTYGYLTDERDYNRQDHSELAAAKKAIDSAVLVAKNFNIRFLRLHLYTDSRMLTFQDSIKRKGLILTLYALLNNIDLYVHWLPGEDNPADPWTNTLGEKSFDINSFTKPHPIKTIL